MRVRFRLPLSSQAGWCHSLSTAWLKRKRSNLLQQYCCRGATRNGWPWSCSELYRSPGGTLGTCRPGVHICSSVRELIVVAKKVLVNLSWRALSYASAYGVESPCPCARLSSYGVVLIRVDVVLNFLSRTDLWIFWQKFCSLAGEDIVYSVLLVGVGLGAPGNVY